MPAVVGNTGNSGMSRDSVCSEGRCVLTAGPLELRASGTRGRELSHPGSQRSVELLCRKLLFPETSWTSWLTPAVYKRRAQKHCALLLCQRWKVLLGEFANHLQHPTKSLPKVRTADMGNASSRVKLGF